MQRISRPGTRRVLLASAILAAGCADLVGADFSGKNLRGSSAAGGSAGAAGKGGNGTGGLAPECSASGDCDQKFPAQGYLCVDQKCVECVDSSTCKDKNAGNAAVCNDHQCVPLVGSTCQTLLGDADKPNAVLIGVMDDLNGPEFKDQQNYVNSVRLASAEITEFGGLPVGGASAPRPVGFIVCDETSDPAKAVEAAKFLVEQVKVPVIIGPVFSQSQQQVYQQVLAPHESTGGTIMLTRSPYPTFLAANPKLAWSCTPNYGIATLALAAYVAELEPIVKATIGAGTNVRVALVTGDDAGRLAIADDVKSKVKINGDTLLNQDGASFLQVKTASTAECNPDMNANPNAQMCKDANAMATNALVAFAPHIIIQSAAQGTHGNVIRSADKKLAAAGYAPLQISLTQDAGIAQSVNLTALVGASFKQRTRVLDYAPVDPSAFQKFSMRYHDKFGVSGSIDGPVAFNYDCTYAAFYAMEAVVTGQLLSADKTLNGNNIRAGLDFIQTLTGSPIATGPISLPNGLNAGTAAIKASTPIQLVGTFGSLLLNASLHTPILNPQLLCAKGTGDFTPSGEYYDTSAMKLQMSPGTCN